MREALHMLVKLAPVQHCPGLSFAILVLVTLFSYAVLSTLVKSTYLRFFAQDKVVSEIVFMSHKYYHIDHHPFK